MFIPFFVKNGPIFVGLTTIFQMVTGHKICDFNQNDWSNPFLKELNFNNS